MSHDDRPANSKDDVVTPVPSRRLARHMPRAGPPRTPSPPSSTPPPSSRRQEECPPKADGIEKQDPEARRHARVSDRRRGGPQAPGSGLRGPKAGSDGWGGAGGPLDHGRDECQGRGGERRREEGRISRDPGGQERGRGGGRRRSGRSGPISRRCPLRTKGWRRRGPRPVQHGLPGMSGRSRDEGAPPKPGRAADPPGERATATPPAGSCGRRPRGRRRQRLSQRISGGGQAACRQGARAQGVGRQGGRVGGPGADERAWRGRLASGRRAAAWRHACRRRLSRLAPILAMAQTRGGRRCHGRAMSGSPSRRAPPFTRVCAFGKKRE
jgi:hypothetical protein